MKVSKHKMTSFQPFLLEVTENLTLPCVYGKYVSFISLFDWILPHKDTSEASKRVMSSEILQTCWTSLLCIYFLRLYLLAAYCAFSVRKNLSNSIKKITSHRQRITLKHSPGCGAIAVNCISISPNIKVRHLLCHRAPQTYSLQWSHMLCSDGLSCYEH